MQLFKYKGYDDNGKRVEGEFVAQTIEEVERRITAQAVTIISIIPAGIPKGPQTQTEAGPGLLARRRRFSEKDVGAVLRDLSIMAQTGVPFVEALDAVIETARTPALAAALTRFRQEIVGGKGLSAGMRAANGLFPPLVCDMVKIAEEGGRLDKALSTAASYVERAAEFKRKVMNALLYPIVLTVIAGGTVVIMITFVMPKFAEIFQKMGVPVPQSTQFIMNLGAFLKTHPIHLVVGIITAIVSFKLVMRSPTVNRNLFRFLFKLPVVGDLVRKLGLSRVCQSVATLLMSNVSVLTALEHGSRVAGNPILRDALLQARTSVEHGGSLSDALRDARAFPPTLVRMVAVGERTGQLGALMTNTAAHLEDEVDGRLKALVSIVEPLMIVFMGVIVGAITVSVIGPLYSIVQNVH